MKELSDPWKQGHTAPANMPDLCLSTERKWYHQNYLLLLLHSFFQSFVFEAIANNA